MSYQKGSDMLLKCDVDGNGTYTAIAAIQTKDLQLSSGTVDVTNQDSSGKWQELLAGAPIKKARVSGRGVFNGASVLQTVRSYFTNGTVRNWQIVVPADGTYTFLAMITDLKYSGDHKGEVQYDISLDSAGAVSFA
jgi:TP901-1 family phage major tail protein